MQENRLSIEDNTTTYITYFEVPVSREKAPFSSFKGIDISLQIIVPKIVLSEDLKYSESTVATVVDI
jgi:hypothetical protein